MAASVARDSNVRPFKARREGHTYTYAKCEMAEALFDDTRVTTMAEMVVLLALWRRMNAECGGMFPSVQTIAGWTRSSEPTVRRTLARLREKGLIECVAGTPLTASGAPKGGATSPTYQFGPELRAVLAPKAASSQPPPYHRDRGCHRPPYHRSQITPTTGPRLLLSL